jgi:hypothetical protein
LEETLGEGEFGKVVSARALNFRGRPGRKPWNKMEKGEKHEANIRGGRKTVHVVFIICTEGCCTEGWDRAE